MPNTRILKALAKAANLDHRLIASFGLSDIQAMAKELVAQFFAGLPLPAFKIVNHTAPKRIGEYALRVKEVGGKFQSKATISIEKVVLDDEKTLRRILVHELIHHNEFRDCKSLEEFKSSKYVDHHGEYFEEMAAKVNAVYGKDFVTKTSDESYSFSEGKEYYIIVEPIAAGKNVGKYGVTRVVHPTRDHKVEIALRIKERNAHVFKTRDRAYHPADVVKKYEGTSVFKTEEIQKKLADLYNTPNLDSSFAPYLPIMTLKDLKQANATKGNKSLPSTLYHGGSELDIRRPNTYYTPDRKYAEKFASQHNNGKVFTVKLKPDAKIYPETFWWQHYKEVYQPQKLFKGYDAVRITEPNLEEDSFVILNPSVVELTVEAKATEPSMADLKKGKVKLTDEERDTVMKAKAVWHHGSGGAESPAVWKSQVKGETWYVTNTHRAYQAKKTLQAAINAFHNIIKSTASLVTSGISDVVYHYTSISSATKILSENQFALTFISSSDDINKPKDKYYYLSTTRSKTGSYHIGSTENFGVLLKLDGAKLQHNYIGNPVDYWGREFRKVAPSKNEMEDRVWSEKPFIEPALKYIDEIHIYFVGVERAVLKRQLRKLLIEAKLKGVPTFLYTDKESAKLLDKRRAIPLSKIDLRTEANREPSRSYGKRDDMATWLELYEKDDITHLSTEPFGGAKRSLTSLWAYDGIDSFKADIHNAKRGTPALHKIVQVIRKNGWDVVDFYKHLQEKWTKRKTTSGLVRLIPARPDASTYGFSASSTKVYHGSQHIYDKFDMSKIKKEQWGKGMYFTEKLKGEDSADSYGEYIYSTEINLNDLFDISSLADIAKVAEAVGLTDFEKKHAKEHEPSRYDWYGCLASELMKYLQEKKSSDWLNAKDIISHEIQKMGYSGLYIPFRNWLVLFNPEKHEIKRDLDAEKKIGSVAMAFQPKATEKYSTLAKKSSLDLSHFSDAKEWVKENVDDVYNGEEYQEMVGDERLNEYISKYNEVKSKTQLEIYRVVVLENIAQLDLKNIGIHWSFEKSGAGDYGLNRSKTKKDKTYKLTAIINPKDICWEYGLTSFMWYGADQWECALNEKAKVTVTKIEGLTEDDKIKLPIKGLA